jgi:hypothetical protein
MESEPCEASPSEDPYRFPERSRPDGTGLPSTLCQAVSPCWEERSRSLALIVALMRDGRQYVGRLLRSHEGEHHIELHDYVDARIPVLERMHTKHLRAYRTIGFDHLPAGTGRRPSRST